MRDWVATLTAHQLPCTVASCAEHYVDELEPLLETIILEDFNVQAEDGSPGEVCSVVTVSLCTTSEAMNGLNPVGTRVNMI